jgi:hypothetical protein
MSSKNNNAQNDQSLNRALRAKAIKSEILDNDDDMADSRDLERYIGRSLRSIEVETSYCSDEGVIAALFDKVG